MSEIKKIVAREVLDSRQTPPTFWIFIYIKIKKLDQNNQVGFLSKSNGTEEELKCQK